MTTRPLILLGALGALLAAAPAHAAKAPSCTRGGAKLLFAQGDVSVVYVTPKAKGGNVPKDKIYGCWGPSGKRTLLFSNWIADESDSWQVVDGRYLGVYRSVEAGVAGYSYADSWDARTGRARYHAAGECRSDEEESSDTPKSAVFYQGGGIAYTCGDGSSRLSDAKGDRPLEAGASDLAVSRNGTRLYYMVGDTAKSLEV
jgi:hypothetical protein